MTMSVDLKQLAGRVIDGDRVQAATLTQRALAEGLDPQVIISEGLIPGMAVVGSKFKTGELYVPEVLVAARAMNECLALLQPSLAQSQSTVQSLGRVVIGTVRGDIHEIGKNLVAMMLRGNGFEVIDLGVDCSPDVLVEGAETHGADAVAVSALLATTMQHLREVVETLVAAGLRDRVRILVGGAPVTQAFADEIGADGYAPDAGTAVDVLKGLLGLPVV
jgi:5-methyltetrahydrofolate--homocysteine methyltransferase